MLRAAGDALILGAGVGGALSVLLIALLGYPGRGRPRKRTL
jgi:hypothetical protein